MRFITIREKLGRPECPYMIRSVINFGLFSMRIYHWISSDDSRFKHTHPWNFITLVLRGGYMDVTKYGREKMEPGTIRYRPAIHKLKLIQMIIM